MLPTYIQTTHNASLVDNKQVEPQLPLPKPPTYTPHSLTQNSTHVIKWSSPRSDFAASTEQPKVLSVHTSGQLAMSSAQSTGQADVGYANTKPPNSYMVLSILSTCAAVCSLELLLSCILMT